MFSFKSAYQEVTKTIRKELWVLSNLLTNGGRSVDAFGSKGGHQHLQIGRMLDIDQISEPPHAPSPQMYVYKVWESVCPEGQEAIHS